MKARSIAPSTPAPELPAPETPGPVAVADAFAAPVHPDDLSFSAGIPPEDTDGRELAARGGCATFLG